MLSVTLAEIASSVSAAGLDAAAGSLIIRRVRTDSREVEPGDLFWALKGERFDGHDFVLQAFAAGAEAAVVRQAFSLTGQASTQHAPNSPAGRPSVVAKPLLCVADTRQALGNLAAWHRGRCHATVIGVTGSVGKTSTREAIHAVLSRRWSGVRSEKSFNNNIGVPLSLLELEPRHDYAIIEMGASGPNEIARLAEIAAPQIGVITTIGPAHLAGFGSIEGVTRAKAELVAALGTRGTAVLNADDMRVRAIGEAANCGVLWYGTIDYTLRLFAQARDIVAAGESVSFRLDTGPRVTVAVPGRHQVYAALAAISVGRWLGMADRDIAAGLRDYRPATMRCQVERLGGVTVINDAYNASPPSMWAALEMLCSWPTAGRRLFVCGDMAELGRAGPEYHFKLGEEIARRHKIDRCVAVGPLSVHVSDGARDAGMAADAIVHCDTVEQATDALCEIILFGDVVLVKASRTMQLERTVNGLRQRFAA